MLERFELQQVIPGRPAELNQQKKEVEINLFIEQFVKTYLKKKEVTCLPK